jgi:hypothetical protein
MKIMSKQKLLKEIACGNNKNVKYKRETKEEIKKGTREKETGE